MSDEKESCCGTETGEPTATRSAAPMWIIVVTLALLFAGGLFLDSHGRLWLCKGSTSWHQLG